MMVTESMVEEAALTWFGELGYSCLGADALAPALSQGERASYGEVVLVGRLREALRRLNPTLPEEAREEALRKVLRIATPSLVQTNRAFHKMLRDGVDVEYARPDGSTKHDKAWLVDFADVQANDWLVASQFTVIEGSGSSPYGRGGGEGIGAHRRPDLVVFVNGLPLALIELKNASDEDATIWSAYAQLQTYKAEVPSLLAYNAALVVSDGLQARMGSLTANQEWLKIWREIEDDSPPPSPQPSPKGRGGGSAHRSSQAGSDGRGTRNYRGGFDFAGLTQRARELRKGHTPAEEVLWELLRDRQLLGAKFRRQHQFGGYICDFYCNEARLVVECDGEPHSEATRIKHDAKRDAYLRSQGLTVIRFENQRVLHDTDSVLSEVASHLPSPRGRRAGDEGQRHSPRKAAIELQTLIYGLFERERFLQLLQHFIVFEENPDTGAIHKIIAGYHQFHAVNVAVDETVRASGMADADGFREGSGSFWAGTMHGGKPGDRRAGVVWHTQGSGKSFTMLFFAARVIREPLMRNPTLVVLTDRNDLDDQLFGQFQRCADILGQMSVRAESRERLRELLAVASGGVVFTTIQKFMPAAPSPRPSPSGRGCQEAEGEGVALSERRNIIVIADEAHRSQYDLVDGLARRVRDALPNASFIGFTGTPIEKADANTRAVFGDYISIYDIERAVADKATVPIYYESRIAKLGLNASELPRLDAEFEELTEGEELTRKEKLKTKWAALEALVGDPKRIALVAADLVAHFEKRTEAMDGKAMVVCMSRRICVDLYNALIRLRPEWASAPGDAVEAEQGKACVAKVIMTGSADDGPEWQPHIRNKERRREMASRFKDPKDPFRIVIVRDMCLA